MFLHQARRGTENTERFRVHFSPSLFLTHVGFPQPPVSFINHTDTVIFSDSGGMAKVPSAEDLVANVLITD